MKDLDIRILVGIGVAAVILLAGAFLIGRATAGGGDEAAAAESTIVAGSDAVVEDESVSQDNSVDDTQAPSGDPSAALLDDPDRSDELPIYGTPEEREALIDALAESGVGMGSRATVLWVADSVCYDFERLQEQNRPPVFAVRVVWNETLSELDSADAAAFGAVFSAAPFYVCPDSITYSEKVAYWLGF
jgi:hypothetical protein